MSGFACPRCSKRIDIFAGNGGQEIARDFKVSLLGEILVDPVLVYVCDLGWRKWKTVSMK
jgi:Mrp family chromosome partitioning ATPase